MDPLVTSEALSGSPKTRVDLTNTSETREKIKSELVALEFGGRWYSDIFETIFVKMPVDSIFGIAIHWYIRHSADVVEVFRCR